MPRYKDQTGAALIMIIGVTAVLALLSATLVFVVQNQQSATASERESAQSFYAAEAAIDSAVQMAKADETMSTENAWLDPDELRIAFEGAFPDGAEVTYKVYDNLADVNYAIQWDQGGPTAANTPDNRVWVEAEATYQDKTTRTRCLIEQTRVPFAEALPKAVTYSDTGIRLNGTSDIYAVDPVTGLPVNDPSQSYQTNITAGGTWIPTMPSSYAEVGRFTMNATADLTTTVRLRNVIDE
jgi:Tfp pilus assembly protein PilX